MKTLNLATLLALTAVTGAVMLSDPAKADFNYYSNGMFGHTYSPMPIYNPVLPLAGGPAGVQPGAAGAQTGGFDGGDGGSDDGNASLTDAAAEAVENVLEDGCDD